MDDSGNTPMPDEAARRVPARPAGRRDQDEPQPRSHPGREEGASGEVPEGGAIGPGPAVARPADDSDD